MPPFDGDVSPHIGVDTKQENKGQFRGYPTYRDHPLKCAHTWLAGKRADDDIGEHWRVHDKLYDLSKFADRHPGGHEWIAHTVGTDVTEAFESSHNGPAAQLVLRKYYVKDAVTPRNSPYTFKENGFYKTLKRKALPVLKEVGTGPTWQMTLMHDLSMISFVCLFLVAAHYNSYWFAIAAGFPLWFTVGMAHNFMHLRDNFRMYYLDLSPMSSSEGRITHAISHHHFTNSIYDIEVAMFEPLMFLLPDPNKNKYVAYFAILSSHLFFIIGFIMMAVMNIVLIYKGLVKLRPESLLPYIELMLMCSLSSSIGTGFWLWCTMNCVASFSLIITSATGTHHTPEIWHQGDAERTDQDWGLCQLDTVRDRSVNTGNLFVVTTTLGDHTLHHLFPTICHSKLPYLYPVFLETCKEFEIPFAFQKHKHMHIGLYRQILNRSPNKDLPGYKKNKID